MVHSELECMTASQNSHVACYDPMAYPTADTLWKTTIGAKDRYRSVFINFGHHPAHESHSLAEYFESLYTSIYSVRHELSSLIWIQSYPLPRRLDPWIYDRPKEHRSTTFLMVYNAIARYIMRIFDIPIVEMSWDAAIPFVDATFDDAHMTEIAMQPVVAEMYRMYKQTNC